MNALIIPPHYPVSMRPIDPVLRDPNGGGAFDALDKWPAPMHEFTLAFPSNEMDMAEALYAFYLRHRGSNPFLFDGAGRCEIYAPQLFFTCDGEQPEFRVPLAGVFLVPTWVWYLNDAVYGDWEMTPSGLFIPDDPPPEYSRLSAKGKRLAKCLFWGDGESPWTSQEFLARLFSDGITIMEVP